MTNFSPSREKVSVVGTVFVFLNSKRSVVDLSSNTPGTLSGEGGGHVSSGTQYSTNPVMSHETTTLCCALKASKWTGERCTLDAVKMGWCTADEVDRCAESSCA